MPQLNRDILREIFYEIIRQDGSFENIDKFMMAGRSQFQLVLDCCEKANSVVILKKSVIVKFPGIKYKASSNKNVIIGTRISTRMKLFKPISFALASSMKSLDIRNFAPSLNRMLTSIDREMKEIRVYCKHLKEICKACANIPNVENGVIVKVCKMEKFCNEMRSFTFPTQKLTIIDAEFNEIFSEAIDSPHLRKNIRDLTIHGRFLKSNNFHHKLDQFATFLSTTFPNLETLNVNFVYLAFCNSWDWNDTSMADAFRHFPRGIKGCICFELRPSVNDAVSSLIQYFLHWNQQNGFDENEYPGLQKNDKEYYKIFPVTDTLSFKLLYRKPTFPFFIFNLLPLLFPHF